MIEEQEYKTWMRAHGDLSEDEIERQWQMRKQRDYDHQWHCAINRHSTGLIGKDSWPKFMYEAKTASHEVARLALVFGMEREGKLSKIFKPCSCCPTQRHIEDNYTTCALGVKCRECPHLKALENPEIPAEEVDRMKAWTCVGHILMNGGDASNEGFVQTVDDRMFWDNVIESLSANAP